MYDEENIISAVIRDETTPHLHRICAADCGDDLMKDARSKKKMQTREIFEANANKGVPQIW